MKTEPATATGTITAIVIVFLALPVSFGLPIADDQQAAILGFIALVALLVVAVWTRPKVTPIAEATSPEPPPFS